MYILVNDIDNNYGYAGVGVVNIWEFTEFSSQFCYKTETFLKQILK